MSSLVARDKYGADEYELGEQVSFLHEGSRLRGTVARVYNTRDLYHVEVDGQRYLVESLVDEMRRETPPHP
jgi:hypothetical protein